MSSFHFPRTIIGAAFYHLGRKYATSGWNGQSDGDFLPFAVVLTDYSWSKTPVVRTSTDPTRPVKSACSQSGPTLVNNCQTSTEIECAWTKGAAKTAAFLSSVSIH